MQGPGRVGEDMASKVEHRQILAFNVGAFPITLVEHIENRDHEGRKHIRDPLHGASLGSKRNHRPPVTTCLYYTPRDEKSQWVYRKYWLYIAINKYFSDVAFVP